MGKYTELNKLISTWIAKDSGLNKEDFAFSLVILKHPDDSGCGEIHVTSDINSEDANALLALALRAHKEQGMH